MRRVHLCSLPLLAFLATAPVAVAQAGISSPAGQQPTATLNVDARLVVVPVTVRDKKGTLVRTLGKDDFTLAEDGKPQTIRYFDRDSNAPLTLGLLVDVSGSQRTVLDEERTASAAFLDNLLKPEQDKGFIVQFGHQADLLTDITASVPKLQAGLKKIDADSGRPQFHSSGGSDPNDPQSTSPQDTQDNGRSGQGGSGGGQGGGRRRGGGGAGYGGGGTVLYDAVFLSSDEVIAKQKTRKALILLTDGDDRGSKESISSAIEAAQRADASLYAIYFKGEEHGGGFPGGGFPGGGGGHRGGFPGGSGYPGGGRGGGGDRERVDGKKILERMADETGGRVFTVSKKEPLAEIYRQIAEELRSQYRLGFTPTDTSDGYHKLIVDLPKDKKSFIQAREGYYTGTAAK